MNALDLCFGIFGLLGLVGCLAAIQHAGDVQLSRERDVQITPVMVREALRVLYRSGRLKYEAEGADELLLKEILLAALSVPRASEQKTP